VSKISGECLCGKIKYQLNTSLGAAISCHCSRCRKAFSGAGSAGARVNESDFHWITGEDLLTAYYVDNSAHGLGFCNCCGTTLVRLLDRKVVGIMLGPLNGNPNIKLSAHIFVGSKASWDEVGSEISQYDEWPPKDVMDKLLVKISWDSNK